VQPVLLREDGIPKTWMWYQDEERAGCYLRATSEDNWLTVHRYTAGKTLLSK
jgi:hypothetical protein